MAIHSEHSPFARGALNRHRLETLDSDLAPGPLARLQPAPAIQAELPSPHVLPMPAAEPAAASEVAPHAWLSGLPAPPFGPPGSAHGEAPGENALSDLPPPAVVAVTAPAAVAAPAAATASTLEAATLELTLADPLNRELIAAYGGALPMPGGGAPGPVLQQQVAHYGADLTARLTQLAQANDTVRQLYLSAMDEAARGLGPGTMGAVFVPASRGDGRGSQTPASWRFDAVAFTQAYARAGQQDGAPLVQRAFAALHGADALQAWERHEGGDTASVTRCHTLAGSFALTPSVFTDIDGHPNRERMAWVAARLDASVSGLRPLSLQAPPELHNPQAVWFDASLGWVTSAENVVVKAGFLDKAVPMVFVGVMTWATAGAFGLAGGAGVSAGTGIGAAGGAAGGVAGAMIAGAAFGAISGFYGGLVGQGRIDLRGMLRGALTGAVTAGVTQATGLNGIELNGSGQVTSYAQRALAVTGQATLQGALQEIAGGRFRDGFTAGMAQGLGAEVARGLNLKIAELQGSQAIDTAQAGALRQFARAAQSAVALLARPDDPGHAFALTFVNGLVGDVQGGLNGRELQGSGPWSDAGYRNGADVESDRAGAVRESAPPPAWAWGPDETSAETARLSRQSERLAASSAFEYANGADLQSDHWVTAHGPARAGSVRWLTVGAGQTLSGLAATSDPDTLDRIAEFNGLASRHELRAGQRLALPDADLLAAVVVSRGVAQRGETLAARSAQHHAANTADDVLTRPDRPVGAPSLPVAAEAPRTLDPLTELQQILRYAEVRNSDLLESADAQFWTQRAQDLTTVAQRYKALSRPADGQPWVGDAVYYGLMTDAQVARGLARQAIGRGALDLASGLMIETGGMAGAGAAAATRAGRSDRAPVTSEGTATASMGARLQADLQRRAGIQPDTSRDAQYIAMTDPRVSLDNRFDWDHVLAGEVNQNHRATGYHAEFAANGAARIRDGAVISQNANGTYEAKVDIWDPVRAAWVQKRSESTFFPADWSRARIEYEVTSAFSARIMITTTTWRGLSPSNIVIEGHINPNRTTFYPLGE